MSDVAGGCGVSGNKPHHTGLHCEGTEKQEVQQALLGCPTEGSIIVDKKRLCVH